MDQAFHLVEVPEMNPGEQPENLNVEKQGDPYEEDEETHIDEIVCLLQEQKESVKEQMEALSRDYEHVLRKLCFYGDVRSSLQNGEKRPNWNQYRDRSFRETDSQI